MHRATMSNVKLRNGNIMFPRSIQPNDISGTLLNLKVIFYWEIQTSMLININSIDSAESQAERCLIS